MMSEEKVETAASANFFAEPQHQALTPILWTTSTAQEATALPVSHYSTIFEIEANSELQHTALPNTSIGNWAAC